jgi:hypothetical protein
MTDDLKFRLLNEDHPFHEAACHEAWSKIEALTAALGVYAEGWDDDGRLARSTLNTGKADDD